VGGNRAIKVDVRVISATNRDLAAATQANEFREDLYFRLAVIPMTVPALRERTEDIPALVEHFAAQVAKETGRRPRAFNAGALELLRGYPFPGNVRELRNLVERLVIMSPGAGVGAEEVRAVLPRVEAAPESPGRLGDAVREFEKRQIEAALAAEGRNVTRAAARLGLERSHLYKKMRKLGLPSES
jgi:two-component system nitrogen regulation response regulator NtrX